MPSYKQKIAADLTRWIDAGLVNADKRDEILATIPDPRRLDAASALAWIGAVLLGVAAIAFIAANWSDIPRLVRFVLVLGVFAAAAGGAAWCAQHERPRYADGLLTFAALVFAAAIGLTGQIFDIVGDPRAALRGAGVAAFALALAGRSTGAAIAGLAFFGLADFSLGDWISTRTDVPWLCFAAPLGLVLTQQWKSAPLAHASAVALLAALAWTSARLEEHGAMLFLTAILLAGVALLARRRWRRADGMAFASVFYGWFAAGALIFFVIAGYVADAPGLNILHRLAWLVIAGGMVALGRNDQHNAITTVGVLGLIGAIFALLSDLGLNLLAAAGLFFVAALAALVIGLALRQRAKAEAKP